MKLRESLTEFSSDKKDKMEVPVDALETEKNEESGDIEVVVQRHGDYIKSGAGDDDLEKLKEEYYSKLGHLSEKGEKEAREQAREKIREILKKNKRVNFVVLYSPTRWTDTAGKNPKLAAEAEKPVDEFGIEKSDSSESKEFAKVNFGVRGRDTAKIMLEVLGEEVRNAVLLENPEEKNPEKLNEKIKEKAQIFGIGSNKDLKEANIFYTSSDKERGPQDYIKELHNSTKEPFGWLEGYYNQNLSEELEELRKKTGAESSEDISERIKKFIDTIRSKEELTNDKDRKLIVWVVSHQAPIRTFLQYGLDTNKEISKKDLENYPKTGGIMDLNVSPDGKITTSFNGKKFEYKKE